MDEAKEAVARALKGESVRYKGLLVGPGMTDLFPDLEIWWCLEHEQNGPSATECYFYRQCQPPKGDCRMVEAFLVNEQNPPCGGLAIRTLSSDVLLSPIRTEVSCEERLPNG